MLKLLTTASIKQHKKKKRKTLFFVAFFFFFFALFTTKTLYTYRFQSGAKRWRNSVSTHVTHPHRHENAFKYSPTLASPIKSFLYKKKKRKKVCVSETEKLTREREKTPRLAALFNNEVLCLIFFTPKKKKGAPSVSQAPQKEKEKKKKNKAKMSFNALLLSTERQNAVWRQTN